MPEYLAPGVYVEEIPAIKFLEGVSTSTAAVVGQTTFGPVSGRPAVLTSFSEYRNTYGSWDDLKYGATSTEVGATNFTAHAVRAFFDNGGKRIYVSRVFALDPGDATDDYARHEAKLPLVAVSPPVTATVRARFPGSWGNQLRVVFKLAPRTSATNLIGKDTNNNPILRGVYKGAMVQTSATAVANASLLADDPSLPSTPTIYYVDYVNGVATLFDRSTTPPTAQPLPAGAYLVELTAQVFVGDGRLPEANYGNLSTGQGAANFVGTFFDPEQPTDDAALISVTDLAPTTDGLQLLRYLCSNVAPTFLSGGDDGHVPVASDYQGEDDEVAPTGLHAFDRVDDIAIVLAADAVSPALLGTGSFTTKYATHVAINNFLVQHCESLKYRFAILDEPAASSRNEAIQFRSQFDSSYAAIYYPWIRIVDPRPEAQGRLLNVPPSGSMAGIYARTDINRGVWKAPANEVVLDAVDLEFHIHKGVQDVLNPIAVNCLRFFEQGGFRAWGARTLSSDPEWKYINVRRLFLYMEHSIDKGTQWVVFEPNNEKTWANVRHTVEAFLLDVWKAGALMGSKPEEAYFVKCDRTTMTQNDLANGRLVCVIGVAPAFPAEFVIFRIGQWTADSNAS